VFERLKNFFKPKTKHKFSDVLETVITDERIDVEHKETGDVYSFNIGHTSGGRWFALTDEKQVPKFCFEASDRDDAYARGVEGMNFYFTYIDTKEQNDHS
jgi:hypothetical protein